MRIVNASFITSATNVASSPPPSVPEIAFIGRSNVGKSSLINMLAGQKGLAKSSSTPGKTRLINFFSVEFDNDGVRESFRFVDLPGFGYAKVSKEERRGWEENLTAFLYDRVSIRLFLLLRDARHPLLDTDMQVRAFFERFSRRDFVLADVFTKMDKLNKMETASLKQKNRDAYFISSLAKSGKDELINGMYQSMIFDKGEHA